MGNEEKSYTNVPEAFDWFLNQYSGNIVKNSIEALYNNYVSAPETGNGDFWEKTLTQLETIEKNEDTKYVFALLMWLQYLPAAGKPEVKKEYGKKKIDDINNQLDLTDKNKLPYYECDGCAGYGMASMKLDDDMVDLILMFHSILEDDKSTANVDDVKADIINWCLDKDNIRTNAYEGIKNKVRKKPKNLLPINNMLLYMCAPGSYQPICSSSDKEKIVSAFECLLEGAENSVKNVAEDSVDEKINKILLELAKCTNPQAKQPLEVKQLYQPEYSYLWNIKNDNGYSDISSLEYKKAMILYGPPGTSKSYTADSLALNIIYRNDYKKDIEGFFNKKDIKGNQIHKLQLHPNYTYEDFIWGWQIGENGKTVAKKGYFLKLLDKIKDGKTHVLILDEINRVDLSRLFGELFSAIEKRGENVDLPVDVEGTTEKRGENVDLPVDVEGTTKISVPENLYIIGTMNEIDFSLERVDFALRRRFVWSFYGYDKDILSQIIESKNEALKKDRDDLVPYINKCTALNAEIENHADFGRKYQIGHTFFAELMDIWGKNPRKEIETIQKILWNVSIGPMIDAYCGSMDETSKDDFLKKCSDKFGGTYKSKK